MCENQRERKHCSDLVDRNGRVLSTGGVSRVVCAGSRGHDDVSRLRSDAHRSLRQTGLWFHRLFGRRAALRRQALLRPSDLPVSGRRVARQSALSGRPDAVPRGQLPMCFR